MHPLTGYGDSWSVKPGGRIGFMVSSVDDTDFELRFVRHICADPNPNGPGYHEIAMPSPFDGLQVGRFQQARPGSFAHAPAVEADISGGFSIAATVWPTTPGKGRQTFLCLTGADWSLWFGIGSSGGACLEVTGADGQGTSVEVTAAMLARRWYDVAAGQDGKGRLWVRQVARRPVALLVDSGKASGVGPEPDCIGGFSVLLAAAPAGEYFNGKLERPSIWGGDAEDGDILTHQRQAVAEGTVPGLMALWDFSLGMASNVAFDIGPAAANATLVHAPGRAMTGASWTGAVHDWVSAPEQYGAIHFHDDDVGDLAWDESFALQVPTDWPSGFYAAHIRNGAGEDMIPFFVRPLQPTSDVVLLVPTYTYQVYGCHVRPGRAQAIHEQALAWGALTETPDINRQFGLSSYNNHSDGSGVAITSFRRPMLDTRPKQFVMLDPNASGTSRICSDSYIVQWLTSIGVAHDVVTDHDLHAEGEALLAPYRVVIAAQHPEYLSDRMMQALETYLEGGGRMMYLGGNGFYWRAEPSAAEPHLLEIRRAENGIRVWATEPGENYQAFGGGLGGLWRRVGRPSHRLVGSGFSAQGRQLGFPYRFTDGIHDPRVAFMCEGLQPTPGESFGETGFMGGGAAGFELDSVDPAHGTPPNTLVVAKGIVIHPDYYPVNEDRLATALPKKTEDWSCADILFFETPAGGAVFSVGSMTYVGSLVVDGSNTTLGKLTTNVLRRFIDAAPFA